ncbi:MoxR family ATPase [Glaciecola sp. XM2]|jgi:MoxR-like ATPase|uniref:AAA family ATPase n=1 Tax=Glaciecola sp. XM2 TaxID=1914931 RepID=UPI001BDEE562|nr:MoxR family ATPase [Glaciecola sp. XM2]MBT1449463.1 MoxR family ATPase [Glaciecola sp. XM2]
MRTDIKNCIEQISQVIRGKQTQIELSLICLLARGHLLLEDLPGMGKTTLSQSFAQVFGLEFSRVQFTSDLLPADMLGINIYDQTSQQFSFHPGPIFSQVVLADEINRASPKTQSALLEAMAERQVTTDGTTRDLPYPFFVIATQNPLHQSGTHPLPESQLDRFNMQLSLGYPDYASEKAMLLNDNEAKNVATIIDIDTLQQMQNAVDDVKVSESVVNYILNLVNLTRESSEFPNALSPRAAKALFNTSKAAAYVNGRNFVTPEDVQFVLSAVCEHRLKGQLVTQTASSFSEFLLKQVDPLVA